jgi:hypothetical protein
MIRPPKPPRYSRKTVDQALVPCTLPDDPIPRAVRRDRPPHAPVERAPPGSSAHGGEIGTPVEQADVDEPRDREKLSGPHVRLDGRGEEAVARRGEAVERTDPSRRGELRCPDDVELENIGSAGVRVQPLDVQLMTLRCIIRRGLNLDAKPRVLHHEPRDLTTHHGALGSECASGERDDAAAATVPRRWSHPRQMQRPRDA